MASVVTKIGLQSAENASVGGYQINLTRFAVTEFPDVVLSEDDTSLAGVIAYEGRINVVEALTDGMVRFTLTVPKGVPTNGSLKLTEIGIYQDSGELFARAKIEQVYEKKADFGSTFTVVCRVGLNATAINVSVGTHVSMATIPFVSNLTDPATILQNSVAVLDQNYNSDGTRSPSIAVKYGPGGRHWGFVGYDRVYSGLVADLGESDGTFIVNPEDSGFFLDAGEQVIVQVVLGDDGSLNETRNYVYRGDGLFVDMGEKFTSITTSCFINIWKREIPAGYINNQVPIPRTFTRKFNGRSNVIDLPFRVERKEHAWVFAHGLFQNHSSYEVHGDKIIFFETPAADTTVTVDAIEMVQGGDGCVLVPYFFETVLDSEDEISSITLPFAPAGIAYVKFFIGGIFQERDGWSLDEATVNLVEPFTAPGLKVSFLIFEVQSWKNHNLSIKSYSMDTTGFSLLSVGTQKNRNLDNPVMFLGSVFQESDQFNVIENSIQLEGAVPSRIPCTILEMHRQPPQRILALKSETDGAIAGAYALDTGKIRFTRIDGTYFDVDLVQSGVTGKGTVIASKKTVGSNEELQVFIKNASSLGFVSVVCSDTSIAGPLNAADIRLNGAGEGTLTIRPGGNSRTVTMKVMVNNKEAGIVTFNVVQSSGSGRLTVNNAGSATATPDATLVFEVFNGGASTPITLLSSDGNPVEIGYTDGSGYTKYVTKYSSEQFGRSRNLTITAVASDTKRVIGSVTVRLVNNGPSFTVNGSVAERAQRGENITFVVSNAPPNEAVVWRFSDDYGNQVVQVGVTDVFGNWTGIKTSDSFMSVSRKEVDVRCEVGAQYIGKVTLHMINDMSFLVDGRAMGEIKRGSRLNFEILNATPDSPVTWASSDDEIQYNLGKTDEKGYLAFAQSYGSDIGPDRTVSYTAYVADVPTNSIVMTISNPEPKVLVNGRDAALVYPDTSLVFTVQDALPGATLAILSSESNVLETVGICDKYGDFTWTRSFSSAEVVDGNKEKITIAANGQPIGEIELTMISRNVASMKSNGSKSAVVSYGKTITFDVVGAVPGTKVSIVDSEGVTYGSGEVGSNGTFSYTKTYGFDIGPDRTFTVFAQSENVILDQVQLIVLNNVGSNPRFRVDGQDSITVADDSTVIFTITGAKPGAVVTWSIPTWDINSQPLGNVDRNGNLAYVVTYNSSMFRSGNSILVESHVDGLFVGTVTITYMGTATP